MEYANFFVSFSNFLYLCGMIGVFDSGYGGLTILNKICQRLPMYDYIYLGDNARTPYGTRSFEVIYQYTLEAVRYLQRQGCELIIIACNTASAKALRTIQQHDIDPEKVRVLGVIRPTVEAVKAEHLGVLATPGTVSSESYLIELKKHQPGVKQITQQACPLWVPIIESGEYGTEGSRYFVDEYMSRLMAQDPAIETIILGCTHYPIIQQEIARWLDEHVDHKVRLVAQGEVVADSLADYLGRHPEIEKRLTRGGGVRYLTTDSADRFQDSASIFLGHAIQAEKVDLAD